MTKQSEFINYHRQHLKRDVVVSTEGFGSTMRSFFPGIFAGLSDVFSGSTPKDDAVQFPRDLRQFLKLIEEHNYARLSQLPVFIPEGLVVGYLPVAKALREAALHSANRIPELLSHYGQYIAILVNTPQMWMSTKDDVSYYNGLQKARDTVSKALDACYDASKHESTSKYEDVIARNPEWQDVLNETRTATDVLNNIDRKLIDKSTANIMELVDVIRKRAKSDNSIGDNISRQVLTGLADGAYQIAVELEFYSVVYYRTQVFSKAVSDTVSQLSESLKYAN